LISHQYPDFYLVDAEAATRFVGQSAILDNLQSDDRRNAHKARRTV
jgi:hypothetical protein